MKPRIAELDSVPFDFGGYLKQVMREGLDGTEIYNILDMHSFVYMVLHERNIPYKFVAGEDYPIWVFRKYNILMYYGRGVRINKYEGKKCKSLGKIQKNLHVFSFYKVEK